MSIATLGADGTHTITLASWQRHCDGGGLGPTLLKSGQDAKAGAEALFRAVDFDRNGTLSFTEFVSIVVLLAAGEQGDAGCMMQLLWYVMDEDGNGSLSRDEVTRFVSLAENFGLHPEGIP